MPGWFGRGHTEFFAVARCLLDAQSLRFTLINVALSLEEEVV